MAASHRTNRLKVIGNPSVEKLQNGRFRLTFNMTPLNPRNDWYYDNRERVFADFGTLSSAEMNVDGINPRNKETYPNMRLIAVESGNRSRVEGGDYIVQFVYETLGDTFVQVKDDTVDYELNGLRRVTRESIAKEGTDFQKTVGTDFIDHQIDTETAVRCYLASYDVNDTDSSRSVEEVYIESGKLSESKASQSEGVVRVTTSFLAHDGFDLSANTVGPIIAKTTDDFEGYETITVITLQDANGNSVVSDNVVSHTLLSPFTYPGTVEIDLNVLVGPGSDFVAYDFKLTPPCQSLVESTMKISFKTTSDISYSSTDGLWNPTSWAEGTSTGIGWNYSPFSITQAFRGYRATGTTSRSGSGTSNPFAMISGKRIYIGAGYAIQCSGGPDDPVGGEYTLNYDVSLAFEDVDGNKYYKHREVVSTIPAQT